MTWKDYLRGWNLAAACSRAIGSDPKRAASDLKISALLAGAGLRGEHAGMYYAGQADAFAAAFGA